MRKYLSIIASLILLISCGAPKSAMDNESKGNEDIPASFKPANGVLLIEGSISDDKSQVSTSTTSSMHTDTYMNAWMGKNRNSMIEYADNHYHYKHEFATQNDIYGTSSKYGDKTMYQYALVTSLVKPGQYTKFSDNGQMQSTHNQPIFRFYLYDRLNDKTYSSLGHGSSLVMWAYRAAIDRLAKVK